jgi:hypothetical protein
MIGMEGIEYHPGQRKKSGGFKLWMLLVIFVVVVVVVYQWQHYQQRFA